MTVRLSHAQAFTYRLLTGEWQTRKQLQYPSDKTLEALVRAGYAEQDTGSPPRYRKGDKEL